ncbi:hypothetical protein GPECTOR_77g38 [Gonium pectorale]|uniref:DOMON domain-containing protein n=1 Tax=Gonium pectorale TaxID=33097 RepID=A0A150G247_GONPE|nr:hypothetical protein GPECTOR_77g38 [Gonium pectorale]|eukprot:KXZ43942.1 hypothetical protein GPECTOR_77g38 [Gonium pectorale]
MRSFALKLLVCLTLRTAYSAKCHVNFSYSTYPSCAQLSDNVALHWKVESGYIVWAIDVDGVWDWVSVGVSEGGMMGGDLAVARYDSASASWRASDCWANGPATPALDAQQDVSLVSAARQSPVSGGNGAASGSTLVALRRPLDSCDPNGQDRPVLNDTRQTVVFAFGRGAFGYHGIANRGQAEVSFMPSAASAAAGNPPLQALEMRMPNFTIPGSSTTYECVNMELPSDAKYHIYRYEPIIDNTPFVHHFVAYACAPGTAPSSAPGVPYSCLKAMECEEFFMLWAPGISGVDAPAEAALAFGKDSIRHLVLQVHYSNYGGTLNQADSSGFRIHYSPTLKKYDMGVLTIGSYDIAVPPDSSSYTTEPNYCPAGCTSQLAAGGGAVTLVESFYHMHELGRSMVTRHVRGNVELPPLGRREYYNFDYQNSVGIPPATRTLLPGDTLITTCTYTGAGRSETTKYGPSSKDEMCFNFLSYYPYNASITRCISIASAGLAACTTEAVIKSIRSAGALAAAIAADQAVPLPPSNWTFSPYQTTCQRSSINDGGGGGAAPPPLPDELLHGSSSPQPTHGSAGMSGGTLAGILVGSIVGGLVVAFLVGFLIIKGIAKRRQTSSDQGDVPIAKPQPV